MAGENFSANSQFITNCTKFPQYLPPSGILVNVTETSSFSIHHQEKDNTYFIRDEKLSGAICYPRLMSMNIVVGYLFFLCANFIRPFGNVPSVVEQRGGSYSSYFLCS
jgi:hypothetical protein